MVSKKEQCLRCDRHFSNDGDDLCQQCGLDLPVTGFLETAHRQQALRVMEQLNAQRAQKALAVDNLRATYKQLEQETSAISEACTRFEGEIAQLKTRMSEKRSALAANRERFKELEITRESLQQEVDEKRLRLKNEDSLYKNNGQPSHAEMLRLRLEGNKLLAAAPREINFPADLVIALMRAEIPAAAIIKNAEFHKVIKKEDWNGVDRNKWYCDMNSLLSGKVPAGNYYMKLSHLHPDEFAYGIDEVNKKIIIR